MKILGKHISKWWLLLIPPLLLICSPALLMLFFMGNNLAGAIIGPPVIWNRPWNAPPRADLVGRYSESKRRYANQIALNSGSLILAVDGSMKVKNLPYEFVDVSCSLSGTGRWRGPDNDNKIDLDLISDGSPNACKSSSYSFLEVAGRFKPYTLYWVIGDPDSGTGVWLKKEN